MLADEKTIAQVIIPGLAYSRPVATPIAAQAASETSTIEVYETTIDTMETNSPKRIKGGAATSNIPKQFKNMESASSGPASASASTSTPSSIQKSRQNSILQTQGEKGALVRKLLQTPEVKYNFQGLKAPPESFSQLVTQHVLPSTNPNSGAIATSSAPGESTPLKPSFGPSTAFALGDGNRKTEKSEAPRRRKGKPELSISLPPNPLFQSQNSTTIPLVLSQAPSTSIPGVATGKASTSNSTAGHPRAGPPAPNAAPVGLPQLAGGYKLTGTTEDLPYLRSTWMKVEELEIENFLRRFHRYTRGTGASAIASPASNDTEAALEGVLGLLRKWQSIHHTRLGIDTKDCRLNGRIVGERITKTAFRTGYHSMLEPITTYFNTMVKTCEESFRNMTLAEREEHQKFGEVSWMGVLQMDWNFFSAARDRIIELCREEQRRRNSEKGAYGVPAAGPRATDRHMVGRNIAGGPSKSTLGGAQKPVPWNKGTGQVGEFPHVVSSVIRSIPAREQRAAGSSTSTTSNGEAILIGGASDYDSTADFNPEMDAVYDWQAIQNQGMATNSTNLSLQHQVVQTPVMRSQDVASNSTGPCLQVPLSQGSARQAQFYGMVTNQPVPHQPALSQKIATSQEVGCNGFMKFRDEPSMSHDQSRFQEEYFDYNAVMQEGPMTEYQRTIKRDNKPIFKQGMKKF